MTENHIKFATGIM